MSDQCPHCGRPTDARCLCAQDLRSYPGLSREFVQRRREWYSRFWDSAPEDLPQGFKMPGGLWEDPIEPVLAGKNYIIYGRIGCGKTTALKHMFWQLALSDKAFNINGGPVTKILHGLKGRDSEDYRNSFSGGHVLILDDLDKLLGTKYEMEELFYLADLHFAAKHSVFVSMNASPEELAQQLKSSKYDVPHLWVDSFISRLMDRATIIHVKNVPDWRGAESRTEV